MLWLCIDLFDLPLDTLARGDRDHERAFVVFDAIKNRRIVVGANPVASHFGITLGQSLTAAQALCFDLLSKPRSGLEEHQALQQVAAWAGQFSACVSIEKPRYIFLEVAASLRLFNGLHHLQQAIRGGLNSLGFKARFGIAPTPVAAKWLAQVDDHPPLLKPEMLKKTLGELSIQVLNCTEKEYESLVNLGVKTIGDVFTLPADGLARRFGQAFVKNLDKALGLHADPRPNFEPPLRYEQQLSPLFEIVHVESLRFPIARLLQGLNGFLQARGRGVQSIELILTHSDTAPTRLTIRFASTTRTLERLMSVCKAKLADLTLPEPVQDIRLVVDQVFDLAAQNTTLFPGPETAQAGVGELLEQWAARLGPEHVQGIRSVGEHRPELSVQPCRVGEKSPRIDVPPRPFWLLPEPRSLSTRHNRPYFRGILHLEHGPERIDSGWWDQQEVHRDYYVAEHPKGQKYWVYLERTTQKWYLHGIFS